MNKMVTREDSWSSDMSHSAGLKIAIFSWCVQYTKKQITLLKKYFARFFGGRYLVSCTTAKVKQNYMQL
jgi:hypothetical protein